MGRNDEFIDRVVDVISDAFLDAPDVNVRCSNRWSTLSFCDKIVWVSEGIITEGILSSRFMISWAGLACLGLFNVVSGRAEYGTSFSFRWARWDMVRYRK